MYSMETIVKQQVNAYFGKVTKYHIVKYGTFILSNQAYYELHIQGTRYLVLIPLSINLPACFMTLAEFLKGKQ